MKIKFKMVKDIDFHLISFILFDIMFWLYVGRGQRVINHFVALCAVIRIFFIVYKNYRKTLQYIVFPFFILFYLLIITMIKGGNQYIFSNLRVLLQPLSILMYLSLVALTKPHIIKKLTIDRVKFYNIYYFINLIVLVRQYMSGYIFYDNITGLMGDFGTHRLMIFTCFIIILDLNYINLVSPKNNKLKFITLLIAVTALVSAHLNDNTAIFIFLPFVVISYLVISDKFDVRGLVKIIEILIGVTIFICILMANDQIRDFIDKRVFSKLTAIFGIFEGVGIKEERYAYIEYALKHLNGYSCGEGIGRYSLLADPVLSSIGYELRNWGISNISSLIAAGGLVFMFIYALMYSVLLNMPRKKHLITTFILVMTLFYYSQIATDPLMIICTWFMMYQLLMSDYKLDNRLMRYDDENRNSDVPVRN